ncbi:MAG: OmpA family protein, partial [Myxococcales bacterium]
DAAPAEDALRQPLLPTLYLASPERTEAGEPVWYELELCDVELTGYEVEARTEAEGYTLGRIRGQARGFLPFDPRPDAAAVFPQAVSPAAEVPSPPKPPQTVTQPYQQLAAKELSEYRRQGVHFSWLVTAVLLLTPLAALSRGFGGVAALVALALAGVLLWREARLWKHVSTLVGATLLAMFGWSLVAGFGGAALFAEGAPLLRSFSAVMCFGFLLLMLALLYRSASIVGSALLMLLVALWWLFAASPLDGIQLPEGLPETVRTPSSSVAPRYLTLEEAMRAPERLAEDCTRRLFIPTDRLFGEKGAALRPEAETTLLGLAQVVERLGEARIVIEGHVDLTGNPEDNFGSSRRQAIAIKEWLVARGKADAARLEAIGAA